MTKRIIVEKLIPGHELEAATRAGWSWDRGTAPLEMAIPTRSRWPDGTETDPVLTTVPAFVVRREEDATAAGGRDEITLTREEAKHVHGCLIISAIHRADSVEERAALIRFDAFVNALPAEADARRGGAQ